MNAKILILALCAFQLTAAASAKHVTNVTKPLEHNIKCRPAELQAQASSVTQTVQNVAQSSTQNITVQILMEQNRTQEQAKSLNINSEQAQVCLNQQLQQNAAIANASQSQIQQQVANLTSQIHATTQSFNGAVTSANNSVRQISSQFNTCFGARIFAVSNGPSCTATAKMQATSASIKFDAEFESSKQALSQISASAIEGDTAQEINQKINMAQTKLQQVGQKTMQCLQQAAASNTP